MPTPYTGPGGPSRRDWFVWYHRMVDVCSAIHQRGYALICSPADEAMMKDMLEQLVEDTDSWKHEGRPDLYTLARIPQGQLFSFDPAKGKVKTFADIMNAETGFARWKGLYLPQRDGITDPFDVYTQKPH